MSCRVSAEFKRDFESEAQKNGMSNGDYLESFYNEHQQALGEIRTLQSVIRGQNAELARHQYNESAIQECLSMAMQGAEKIIPSG